MPDRGNAGYLLEYLWDVGPTMSGSMGEGPLTHSELQAYQANTGLELTCWEAETLRRLSMEYMNQSQLATKRDCLPPWTDGAPVQSLVEVDTRDAIRALANLK
jgi:hypothetical protein